MSLVRVLTIGHSTRPLDEFIRLLTANGVDRVIDIRTIPRSRHNPQFNRETLCPVLRRAGIRYTHMSGLGGLRHPRRGSVNGGWRNASFRGYADYMQTATFRRSLDRCIDLARHDHVVLMCAEAVPWRCHRSLSRTSPRERPSGERDHQRHSDTATLFDAVGRGQRNRDHLSGSGRRRRIARPLASRPQREVPTHAGLMTRRAD